MNKSSSKDYLDELDRAGDDIDPDLNDDDEGEHLNRSEAEQLAAMAPPPRKRQDGERLGSAAAKHRPITSAQYAFAMGIIQGQTMKQAYRDAYPNDTSGDAGIGTSAYKLSRHPRIEKMLNDAWGQTVEVLADDLAASRRWVMRQLVTVAREGKQEGSRLKALELLGKASGTFTQAAHVAPEIVSADQLKRELSGHLKLLDNVKPLKASNGK